MILNLPWNLGEIYWVCIAIFYFRWGESEWWSRKKRRKRKSCHRLFIIRDICEGRNWIKRRCIFDRKGRLWLPGFASWEMERLRRKKGLFRGEIERALRGRDSHPLPPPPRRFSPPGIPCIEYQPLPVTIYGKVEWRRVYTIGLLPIRVQNH